MRLVLCAGLLVVVSACRTPVAEVPADAGVSRCEPSITCATGGFCSGGTCQCPAGQMDCNGVCTDVSADANNCGACGTTCATGGSCSGGTCQCPAGQMNCSGVCNDVSADVNNCGACGSVCMVPTTACVSSMCACPGGKALCSGVCRDVSADVNNCGACGTTCATGGFCSSGTCQCPAGQMNCAGVCKDVSADVNNCGGCGVVCNAGDFCIASACVPDYEWSRWTAPADAPAATSYMLATDTATDTVTGLMWQRNAPSTTYTWAAAKSYCDALALGGFSDWRLPTRIELLSIVNYGKLNPALDTAVFPGMAPSWCWSSSPLAGNTSAAWVVGFNGGTITSYGISYSSEVRCVR